VAMTARLLAEHGGASVYHSTWRDLLPIVEAAGGCDALIVDAPYSARTHSGHADGTESSNRGEWASPRGVVKVTPRRAIDYGAWGAEDVDAYVAAWVPLTRGWFVSITDHVLAREWERALDAAGLY